MVDVVSFQPITTTLLSPAACAPVKVALTLCCDDCGVTLLTWMNAGVAPEVLTGVSVGPGVSGIMLGVLLDPASSTSTQSLSPALLLPGGVNWWFPLFAKGEPEMGE